MATYQISGTVESVGKTQSFGQRGFTKREFVITPDTEDGSPSRFPNYVPFTLHKDKCSLGDSLRQGDHATVKFAINGRKWDGPNGVRYFTDLVALAVTTDAAAAARTPTPSVPAPPSDAEMSFDGPADDLPF